MIDAIAEPVHETGIQTSAHKLANQNWRSNLGALGETQPEMTTLADAIPNELEWILGRDGALTALLPGGRWWAGCSLPGRAAQFMLGKTDVSATVICFLHPAHAAQLRTALDRMQANQALLAIVPDLTALKMILACEDFAPAIEGHRLFFVAGESWETQLDSLLERQLGLPTPTQFIRPILADSAPADALIAPAQKIFAETSTRRAKHVQTLRERWTSRDLKRICVVAPNLFRLWDDAGAGLLQATEEFVGSASELGSNSPLPCTQERGQGEGSVREVCNRSENPLTPTLSPVYRGEGASKPRDVEKFPGSSADAVRMADGKTASAKAALLSTTCKDPTNACFFPEKSSASATELDHANDKREALKTNGHPQTTVNSAHMTAKDVESSAAKADPTRFSNGRSGRRMEAIIFNPDDPTSASPAALASVATTCDALLMPNSGRADLPDLTPDEMPLLSWVTTPRIPSADKAGPRDVLLLCDPNWVAVAIEQGWKRDRVFVAGWPTMPHCSTAECENPGCASMESSAPALGYYDASRSPDRMNRKTSEPTPSLAIISDTRPLDPPERVTEYSSHRLLWEAIAHELLDDPFALSGTADDYLADRMRKAHVEEEGLDRMAFLTGVIWNAYQQGIALLLIGEKFPVDLFGSGWDQFPEFAAYSRGPVRSREQLATIVSSAQALVHAWPTSQAHPMESLGKPIVRFSGRRDWFIRDARQALAGKLLTNTAALDPLSAATILRALSAADARPTLLQIS